MDGITGVGQIHLTVDDVAAAVEFYSGTLGIPLLFEVPEQEMAFLDCGGVRLYIGKAESPEAASHPLLYFRVSDIDAEHKRLMANRIEFIHPPAVIHSSAGTELWLAFFRDFEGHPLALMEERPAPD